MEIQGIVYKIVYASPANHWTVFRIKSNKSKKLINCVGTCPSLVEGQHIKLKGEEITDSKYGKQIKVKEFTQLVGEDKDSVISFLSNGYLKHIGPVVAERMYEKFGDDVFRIIEKEPLQLAQIKGITATKSLEISETYKEHKNLKELNTLLYPSGITPVMCAKIYNSLKGFDIITQICEDPYVLISKVDGIGFLKADHFALTSIKLSSKNPKRIEASIVYALEQFSQNTGHAYMKLDEIIQECSKLLKGSCTNDEIVHNLRSMVSKGPVDRNSVVMRVIDDAPYFYFKKVYDMEIRLSNDLKRIKGVKKIYDYKEALTKTLEEQLKGGFSPSKEQVTAVESVLSSKISVLSGGPGTGKSTCTKLILNSLDLMKSKVGICAPTGRASKRMIEITGKDSKTIHRLLGWQGSKFAFNRDTPLPYDTLVIDESSMISLDLFYSILRACTPDTKLIFIGDIDQLPSIGVGSVLKDIMNWSGCNVAMLTKIFRQAEGSLITNFAHSFNKGDIEVAFSDPTNYHYQECSLIQSKNLEDYVDTICDIYSEISDTDTQILCPMRVSDVGTTNINKMIQEKMNPKTCDEDEISIGQKLFRVGDRVIHVVNNYELDVYNGDIGYITQITQKGCVVTMLEGDITYTKGEMMQLELAYAITIHKSQGSEFQNVIIPIFKKSMIMLNKNLIYTAATRAKTKVVFIGEYQALILASKRSSTDRRSYLNELLEIEGIVEVEKIKKAS